MTMIYSGEAHDQARGGAFAIPYAVCQATMRLDRLASIAPHLTRTSPPESLEPPEFSLKVL